ncbi:MULTISPECIES: NUDIX domain-containing protein [unclassified Gemella]|uniref:NUDIX hydrolase n=1 Tax=unclassified Gemella TaxID=2624949 RepID=UPI0010731238|nr:MULTISPECIES: NUDIX domain-containing protein [unclassified Gemella]MBF0709821.1 NUDIX domain-containing protein [Gemella sp. GL1.1]MBF0747090.1 NUDIX domain-containing protein [Gemella sp. 19428wG2_WT2a]NYS27165.1 NUDIX domain-containing protein [Gemella sp. GL1]TFU58333.1 NUDIX domain-containing protein [Gemella sp. WT2a]
MIKHVSGLIKKDNKYLLVKKKKNPSHFILPGGKINEGENLETALIRELEEELSIDVSRSHLTFFTKIETISQFENMPITSYVFLVDYIGPIKVANEIESCDWIDIPNHDINELAKVLVKLKKIIKIN